MLQVIIERLLVKKNIDKKNIDHLAPQWPLPGPASSSLTSLSAARGSIFVGVYDPRGTQGRDESFTKIGFDTKFNVNVERANGFSVQAAL